jgi:dienelactone hydrolase
MSRDQPEPLTGWAAGVPFTALAPAGHVPAAPLVVGWHMMDAPRSDAAFAAALPLSGVAAWRVYLGLPTVGRRPVEGAFEAAQADPLFRYVDPMLRQAGSEFPAALAELRRQLPIGAGPIALVGGSLGGNVALHVLTGAGLDIAAIALVNPAIRARTAVDLVAAQSGRDYPWTAAADVAIDRFDFLAHAGRISALRPQPAVLVVSGEYDHRVLRDDAAALIETLKAGYDEPERVHRTTIPGLAHPLAEPPGLEPAPQLPAARLVDQEVTRWLTAHLPGGAPVSG